MHKAEPYATLHKAEPYATLHKAEPYATARSVRIVLSYGQIDS